MDKMRTVTVKFVVKSDEEADDLMSEIAQFIGNDYGIPFVFSEYTDSTETEIEEYNQLMKRE